MEPHVQQALLIDVANVLRHLAREIPTELVQAGATADDVERAKTDAQTIVDTVVADMTPRDIDILLHFDPMSLALQFIGADDRALAFSAADGPYEAYREQFGEAQVPEAATRKSESAQKSQPLFDLSAPKSAKLYSTGREILQEQAKLLQSNISHTRANIRILENDDPYATPEPQPTRGNSYSMSIESAFDFQTELALTLHENVDAGTISIIATMSHRIDDAFEEKSRFFIDETTVESPDEIEQCLHKIFRLPLVHRFLHNLVAAA